MTLLYFEALNKSRHHKATFNSVFIFLSGTAENDDAEKIKFLKLSIKKIKNLLTITMETKQSNTELETLYILVIL